jgi:hypothetical protein
MAWRQELHRHAHHSSRIALLDLQPRDRFDASRRPRREQRRLPGTSRRVDQHQRNLGVDATIEHLVQTRSVDQARGQRRWPQLDEFSFDRTELGVTRLTGEIRDAAHLHSLMAHLTAVGVELISVAPVAQFNQAPPTTRPERNETS